MRRTHRRVIVCLICAVTALGAGATPLAACDPMWLPVARPEGISVFVALALAETVLDTVAGAISTRTHPGFTLRLDGSSGRTSGGQRVRLLRWAGAPGRYSEAVLVPWAYREDCRPIAWADRLDWIPAGTRGAVTGWLRPRAHWLGGVPTFDVEMAWREPVWAEGEPRWYGGEGGPRRMTPDEFVKLHSALPTFERLERSPREVSAEIGWWEQEHPDLAALAPATTMLAGIHRAAEERARRPLSGRWIADVRLLDGRELPLMATASAISGEVSLEPVPGDSAEVYSGAMTLDFAPLGFRLGSAGVLASADGAGVRIVLDPTVDHGHVVATLTGGEAELAGTWYLNSRPARASGTIRLRRR